MASPKDRAAIKLYLESHVDLVLIAVIVFAVAGATIFVMSVTIGDWEFWVDWKDRRYWPLAPPAALLIFPAPCSRILGAIPVAHCLYLCRVTLQSHALGQRLL